MRKMLGLVIVLFAVALFTSACNEQMRAEQEAVSKAQSRHAYVQKNDVEFNNYDRRQRLADDPTAIIWCTSAFPIPSSPLFTVPVVGKLTSGNKRPFTSDPGPDGMYGSSGEYRYGFTPSDMYADWYGMPTFCTNEPTVWQREQTAIVMESDPLLVKAHEQAREFLKKGKTQEAYEILSAAIKQIGGNK